MNKEAGNRFFTKDQELCQGNRGEAMLSVLRWNIKKTARAAVAFGSWSTRNLDGKNEIPDESLVRVLTYHRFGNAIRDPFCVAPADFEKQMACLAEHGSPVSIKELEDSLYHGKTLSRPAVLVTIDDGFMSTWRHALPILKEYKIPAMVFITPGLIGQEHSDYADEGYMRWKEVECLVGENIDIGSHSMTHRSLGRMPLSLVEEEVGCSREIIEQNTGVNVTSFAYPFGTRADFNEHTAKILKNAGYKSAFTSQHGAIRSAADPFSLPRVKVEGGEGLWLFKLLIRGGLDPWSWVDRSFWYMQASRHD